MSRQFVASTSIRRRFQRLLDEGCGVAGWLDMEDCEYHSLADPSQTFWPAWEPGEEMGADPTRTDRLAAGLARASGMATDGMVLRPEWRTAATVGLASVVQKGSFDLLPILADALQEAGCEDSRLLRHCRVGGIHAGGCRVAEMILIGGQ